MVRFYLYDEPAAEALNVGELAEYLGATFSRAEVTTRAPCHRHFERSRPDGEEWLRALAQEWARAKVLDPMKPVAEREPLYGEVGYEVRRLSASQSTSAGLVYDGLLVQATLRELLPPEESRLTDVHLVFTRQTLATFSADDLRYHINVLVGGVPSLISTTGLVEGPAKPREHYMEQAVHRTLGQQWSDELAAVSGADARYLLPDDPRTTEVLKGYVLQAAFNQLAGEAFCDDPDCRLYNARWQEDMLRAQLGDGPELCPSHEALLARV